MSKFKLENDLFYDTRTGTVKSFDATGSKDDCYAVLYQSGHCGKGYFIPQIKATQADSKELAIAIVRNSSRAKTGRKNVILAVTKISKKEHAAIEYFNACDPYRNNPYNTESLPYVRARRVAMQEAIDYENSGSFDKIQLSKVRTANQYPEHMVLQRHTAPTYYGDKLVFPKNINLRGLMEDYIYYETINYGFMRGKVPPIAFYYQLYGNDNKLGIRYKNGKLSYKYKQKIIYVNPTTPEMKMYLDEAKEQFDELDKIKKQEEAEKLKRESSSKVTIKSSTDRFNDRFKKYLDMKNRDSKLPND